MSSSLSKENKNVSGTPEGDWKPPLSFRRGEFQAEACCLHSRTWAAVCSVLGVLPQPTAGHQEMLYILCGRHTSARIRSDLELWEAERTHCALTLPHCTLCLLCCRCFPSWRVSVHTGQKALMAHEENACELPGQSDWDMSHCPAGAAWKMDDKAVQSSLAPSEGWNPALSQLASQYDYYQLTGHSAHQGRTGQVFILVLVLNI